MKRFVSLLTLICSIVALHANDPHRGYRGFLDWDNNITSYTVDWDHAEAVWFTGLSTTHGFQFNPHFFVGAGLMIERSTKFDMWTLPVFAQARYDGNWSGLTLFADVRLGYNCCDGGGIYISPTIGYRFNFGRKLNLNLGLGMTLRGSTYDKYDIIIDHDSQGSGLTSVDMVYAGKRHETKPMFTLRLGIDF